MKKKMFHDSHKYFFSLTFRATLKQRKRAREKKEKEEEDRIQCYRLNAKKKNR
jgi:hypothetical protein